MIRNIAAALLIGLFLLRPAAALDQQGTARTLMQQSGMWEQLGLAQGRIDEALSQLPSNKAADSMRAAAHKAYGADRLRARAEQEIAGGLDARHAPALLKWFASPDGVQISQAEAQAMDARIQADTMPQRGQQALQEASSHRRRQLGKLLVASRAVESTVEIAAQELIAVRRGVAKALGPSAKAPSEAELRRLVYAQRPMFEKMYREGLQATFAMVYADVPDDVVERYVAFLNSPAGRHFTEIGVRAMIRALAEAAEAMGSGLARQGA